MFDATKWNLIDGPMGVNSDYGVETPFLVSSPLWNDKRDSSDKPTIEIAILKRFPFESTVKRMTVSKTLLLNSLEIKIIRLELKVNFKDTKHDEPIHISFDLLPQVIGQRKGSDHYNVFIKGAPETIAGLCDPVTGCFPFFIFLLFCFLNDSMS